jgi:hypothetical protein
MDVRAPRPGSRRWERGHRTFGARTGTDIPVPHAAGFVLPTDAELEALVAGLPVDWAATVRRAGGSRASVVAAPAAVRAPAGGSNWLLPVDELAAYLGIAKKAAYDCWQQRRVSGLPGRPEPAVPRATRAAMAPQPGLSTPVGRRDRTHGGRWGRQRRPDRRRAERWLSATSRLDEAAIERCPGQRDSRRSVRKYLGYTCNGRPTNSTARMRSTNVLATPA